MPLGTTEEKIHYKLQIEDNKTSCRINLSLDNKNYQCHFEKRLKFLAHNEVTT